MKKKIYIDFDGVINNYDGWRGYANLHEPQLGVREFLNKLSHSYEIYIFSTRNPLLIADWLIKHDLRQYIASVTNVKEPAYVYIDDRAIRFNGDYSKVIEELEEFKVWWRS